MLKIQSLVVSLVVAMVILSGDQTLAADIVVPTGTGTLANAIATAQTGDVLLLQDGNYTSTDNATVVINKSVTIRSASKYYTPHIGFYVDITGTGISVTIQGLSFEQGGVVINQADKVEILQNSFSNGGVSATGYKTSEGDGELFIIGNTFTTSSGLYIYSDGAYVAGNIFTYDDVNRNDHKIIFFVPGYFVGNDITSTVSENYPIVIKAESVNGPVHVVGNRIAYYGYRYGTSISLQSCLGSIVSNNLLLLSFSGGTSYYESRQGVRMSASSFSTIENNIITRLDTNGSSGSNYGIYAESNATVRGNIFYNLNGLTPVNTVQQSTKYNILFPPGSSLTPSNGNLNLDPEFVDLNDYRLSATSPAINAGPLDYRTADLDRSRNDIGIYGGPWSIEQFDRQRDSGRTKPFVYPIFDSSDIVANDVLKVRALGIARLQ